MAAGDTATLPFCGSCGWDAKENLNHDGFCDACGADLHRFAVGDGLHPPVEVSVVPGDGDITFTWQQNPAADEEESRYAVGFTANWSEWAADSSPSLYLEPTGSVVTCQVRSIVDGIAGHPLTMQGTTA